MTTAHVQFLDLGLTCLAKSIWDSIKQISANTNLIRDHGPILQALFHRDQRKITQFPPDAQDLQAYWLSRLETGSETTETATTEGVGQEQTRPQSSKPSEPSQKQPIGLQLTDPTSAERKPTEEENYRLNIAQRAMGIVPGQTGDLVEGLNARTVDELPGLQPKARPEARPELQTAVSNPTEHTVTNRSESSTTMVDRTGMDRPNEQNKTKSTNKQARSMPYESKFPTRDGGNEWQTASKWTREDPWQNRRDPWSTYSSQTATPTQETTNEETKKKRTKNLRIRHTTDRKLIEPWSSFKPDEPIFADQQQLTWLSEEELRYDNPGAILLDRSELETTIQNIVGNVPFVIVLGGIISRDKLLKLYGCKPDLVQIEANLLITKETGSKDLKIATVLGFNVTQVQIAKQKIETEIQQTRVTHELLLEARGPNLPENREEWRAFLLKNRALINPELGIPRKSANARTITIRSTPDEAMNLIKLSGKHNLFGRYIIKQNQDPLKDISIIWFSVDAPYELAHTLPGFQGLIPPKGTTSSFGARIEAAYLEEARKTLRPDLIGRRFGAINSQVQGRYKFTSKGWPSGVAPEDVIQTLYTVIGWKVIPGKRTTRKFYDEFELKADCDPDQLTIGTKQGTIVIDPDKKNPVRVENVSMTPPREYEMPQPNQHRPDHPVTKDDIVKLIEQGICGAKDKYDHDVEERFQKLEANVNQITQTQQAQSSTVQELGANVTRQIEMLLTAITQTKQTVDKYSADQQDIKKAVMQMAEQNTHGINDAASPLRKRQAGANPSD